MKVNNIKMVEKYKYRNRIKVYILQKLCIKLKNIK